MYPVLSKCKETSMKNGPKWPAWFTTETAKIQRQIDLMLTVNLKVDTPESKKPRLININ